MFTYVDFDFFRVLNKFNLLLGIFIFISLKKLLKRIPWRLLAWRRRWMSYLVFTCMIHVGWIELPAK
jgi:hypothetical protein